MRLRVEMIPKSAWSANLRSLLTQSQWDKVRKKSYALANYQCDICGVSQKKLSCHEVWEYDDDTGVQKLVKLEALCNKCHLCKHIGFAFTMHYEGNISLAPIIEHFLKVNGIAREEFNMYLLKEINIWAERSKKEWTLDVGYLYEFIAKNNISIGKQYRT